MIDYGIDYNNVFVYVGLSDETKVVWWNFMSILRKLDIVRTRISGQQLEDNRHKVIFEFKKRSGSYTS
jgi:hypothetical protein